MFYKSVARFNKERPNVYKQLAKDRLIVWRKQNSVTRIERPTKLDRARRLGYKPIQGITVVRVKISRGGRRLSAPTKGRRSKRSGVNRITPNQSRQVIAEKRVSRRFPNMEVLNSYQVGQDGKYIYYESILVDPHHPRIKSDKNLNWLSPDPTKFNSNRNPAKHKGRAFRGLTSAGKKSRGLRNKGTGAEQFR